MVGTLAGTDRVFKDAKRRIATNYGIQDTKVHQYVEDDDYAFGSGTTHSNRYGISIEHEGGQMLKSGSRKKPTRTTHETSAKLCAMLSKKHGMGELKVGGNVFPHKKFVATQCPGSLDLESIVKRANEINALCKEVTPSESPKVNQEAPKPPKAPTSFVYTIKRGDSLWKIAKQNKISIVSIMKANKLKSTTIYTGGKLVIPKK
jgi:LysM repeat protein